MSEKEDRKIKRNCKDIKDKIGIDGMSRKRIGLLLGQPDESYQKEFIDGFLEQTFAYDYDVCIFAMYRKYQETTNREIGESGIFSLIPYENFDGFVVLADTIQTTGLIERLEDELHTFFRGPVLFVDKESEYFPTVSTDYFHPTKHLISHLIECHGITKIAYLTGKSWHPHSIQRLNGFLECMKEHQLQVRKDWIFEGDFWYTSGESMVEKLLKTPDDLPQAIACANDCMAIGVANALEKKGVRVPEDIAIVGYDSRQEGKTSPKPLTSVPIPSWECGKHTGKAIRALLDGTEIPDFNPKIELFIGSSCGCKCDVALRSMNRESWEVTISERDFLLYLNSMMDDLMCQTKLTDLMNVIFSYTYQIQEFSSFHLCLNEQWETMESLCMPNADWSHYSNRMLYALECRQSMDNPGRVDLTRFFDKTELLPELQEDREQPKAFLFTPLHFEEQCMGYAVWEYGKDTMGYDQAYSAWISNVTRGLESLRRLTIANHNEMSLQECHFEQNRLANLETALQNMSADTLNGLHGSFSDVINSDLIKQISETEREERKLVEKILDENLFTYYFQPIVDAKTGEIFAYEALMRTTTKQSVPPLTILKYAEQMNRLYDVEKYTFYNVLTCLSERQERFVGKKIFINSIPGIILNESDTKEVVELLQDNSKQIVIELTEQAEIDDEQLLEIKEKYARIGMETAIDDYGTGYSNILNLLRYMPRYVKIDRGLLTEIHKSPQKQHFVKEIIEFSHDNRIIVLAEGIETYEEMQTVIHLGVDLIQGYYTARPGAEVLQNIDVRIKREIHQLTKQLLFDKTKKVYTAGKEFRISLAKLHSEECEYIVIPNEETTYRDLDINGVPGMASNMMIQIADGYHGRLVLNNVSLGTKRGQPCIDIGEDCDLTLVLRGENEFRTGGIRVSENSRLTLDGEGSLLIQCNYDGCFGIGNDMDKRHGDLIFEQDGTIEIKTNAKNSVAIGSGMGGNICINRGKYVINMVGNKGVAIGSVKGETDIRVLFCDVSLHSALFAGVGIGSETGNVNVLIKHVSLNGKMNGTKYVGIGSFEALDNRIVIQNTSLRAEMNAKQICGIGCVAHPVEIEISYASFILDGEVDEVIILGDIKCQSVLLLRHSEVFVNLKEYHNHIFGIHKAKLQNENGRIKIRGNDGPVELWKN